jgi:hypothetical protein
MVFKKTVVQVWSNNTPFSFIDFFRGTLSLIQYGLDNKLNVRVNLNGCPISQYLIVENYDTHDFAERSYIYDADYGRLYDDLEVFRENDAALLVVNTNWVLNVNRITDFAVIEFKKIIQFTSSIYEETRTRLEDELLNIHIPHTVPTIDELIPYAHKWALDGQIHNPSLKGAALPTDYSIIYVDINASINLNYQDTLRLVETIRNSLLLNRNIILLSSDKRLKNWLSERLEVIYTPGFIENDTDDVFESVTWSARDEVVNFILLANCKKLYVFSERSKPVDKIYDIPTRMLCTSIQHFTFFYSKVEISPMPGF